MSDRDNELFADLRKQPASLGAVVAILVGFALFLILIAFVYLRRQPAPLLENDGLAPAQRAQTLADLRTQDQQELTTYGWIDQGKGVVRLPIDRAMELEVRAINAARAQN